jgi:hypothetical protein
MALTTLVTNPTPLVKQVVMSLQQMIGENRDFSLAMLVPSETGLSDRWNLVLSAPWIDRGGLNATIPAITTVLLKHLTRDNAHKLERVSVLPTSDTLVATLEALQIPLGEIRLLQHFPRAEGAIVLVSERPEATKGYRSQPLTTRA